MNEQIKQLAEQAQEYAGQQIDEGANWDDAPIYYTEKFAELIVRECVSIIAKRKDQAIDDGYNVDEAMSMAEMDLEEHFGVEE
jgi:hypothetical protein